MKNTKHRTIITGICGFVGNELARGLIDSGTKPEEIIGIDNLSRRGAWLNRESLTKLGVTILHGDIRNASDLESIGHVDWIIDAAANPSVLAGVDGKSSTRQLIEHNLVGTINLLEHCKACRAGFILLSTSRVYGIEPLATLELKANADAFTPVDEQRFPAGLSRAGISESFSTTSPISLYGATKLASETLALEYGGVFDFPVWINRCGVLAGAGQFGQADQGVFSFWIHSWRARRPLNYTGFDGTGNQVRDCLHPADLIPLLRQQLKEHSERKPRVVNVGGGLDNSMSLKQLSDWCEDRFGSHHVGADPGPRPFDLPWIVMDSSLAGRAWDWYPRISIESILEEIAQHSEANPEWLDLVSR